MRIFPRKIDEFLKDCNDEELFAGYEMVNRHRIASLLSNMGQNETNDISEDLFKNLRTKYPHEEDFNQAVVRIATIAAAIWSIDGVLHQDASFKLKVNECSRKIHLWNSGRD